MTSKTTNKFSPEVRTRAVRLVLDHEGESPVAENIQFHEDKIENGIATMRRLEAIEVPPGASVRLKPDGIHLMMRLKRQLQLGEAFLLTLKFEKAGAVDVTFNIGRAGAMDDTSGK